jgi:hypothetical protein
VLVSVFHRDDTYVHHKSQLKILSGRLGAFSRWEPHP